MKRAIAIVLGGLVLAGCGSAADDTSSPPSTEDSETVPTATRMDIAAESCRVDESQWASLGDDGHTLSLDGGDDLGDHGLSVEEQVCVLNDLEVTDAALDLMSNTTAMDGRQETEWDGITASWTYHPDNGLDILLTEE